MNLIKKAGAIYVLASASFLSSGCASAPTQLSFVYDDLALNNLEQVVCETTNFLGIKNGHVVLSFKGIKEDKYTFDVNGKEYSLKPGDKIVEDKVEILFEQDEFGLYHITFSK
ncbi:hypothetical protein HZA97_01430 [Candidatus Woesearchaeota archaeon]|nr:hypothetical protein [Candidatus Woesearchaeota archaeon]